jgi:hypothetical protein
MRFQTVEQMQDEIEQLRVDYNESFADGAMQERAKIVAWLRSPRGEAWLGFEDQAIEAEEHLK